MWRGFLILLLTLSAAPQAAAEPVDLELVLAVDVSRSIDDVEAKLQRDGYIDAFTNQRVIDAIQSGPVGAIAVTYVEWASYEYQRTMIPWTRIADRVSAENFASQIAELPRVAMSWTSISGAIDYSRTLFGAGGFTGARRVIDISGDGSNNSGRPADVARDEAVARGIVINGLPILNDRPNFGRPPQRDLDAYYESNVIGGPGSFLIPAEDFNAFGAAILNKLIREIAARPADKQEGRACLTGNAPLATSGWTPGQRSSVVEQGNHNPLVGGSNPSAATN
jgi:hypothetical protein